MACIDVIESNGEYSIKGIVIPNDAKKKKVLGYNIIGFDHELHTLLNKTNSVLLAIGQIKNARPRVKLYQYLKDLGANLPVIFSSRAYCSGHSSIGEGTIVMHDVVINSGVKIGANCILNTKALIEHGSFVGDHCHISTGAILNGGVVVGSRSFVGSGAVIKEGVKIGDEVIVGAGQVVLSDVPDGTKINGR